MFRMKRTRWISFALLLGVLLLPLPAMAAGFWEGASSQGWGGWWADLLGWLGLGPSVVETTSPMIDPNGQPGLAEPTWSRQASSSYIDPLGQPQPPGSANSDSSPFIDPNGQP